MNKAILFLSIMDFTDKGIQVVKLTPEYFSKKGWVVHYCVLRDNSKNGSYYYQDAINPPSVTVYRADMPSCSLGETLKNHTLKTIYSKLRGYAAVFKLSWIGYKLIRKNKIDVIYGGGPHGVLAASILKMFYLQRQFISVARFYGVWDLYSQNIVNSRWFKLLLNFDLLIALYLRADLKIITNDGTQGDKALEWIRPTCLHGLRYYVNGTDKNVCVDSDLLSLRRSLLIDDSIFTVICITRLVSIKRIDRCIKVAASIVHRFGMKDFRMIIVGDGPERLQFEQLAINLGVSENIIFTGAIDNKRVINYLLISDVFLSMYDVSNVGNPLLEAIRANKIIFTLNNGDTSNWIQHGVNGFIYDVDDSMTNRIAQDMTALALNAELRNTIKHNIKTTEMNRLWTWHERLQAELNEVEKLVEGRLC